MRKDRQLTTKMWKSLLKVTINSLKCLYLIRVLESVSQLRRHNCICWHTLVLADALSKLLFGGDYQSVDANNSCSVEFLCHSAEWSCQHFEDRADIHGVDFRAE